MRAGIWSSTRLFQKYTHNPVVCRYVHGQGSDGSLLRHVCMQSDALHAMAVLDLCDLCVLYGRLGSGELRAAPHRYSLSGEGDTVSRRQDASLACCERPSGLRNDSIYSMRLPESGAVLVLGRTRGGRLDRDVHICTHTCAPTPIANHPGCKVPIARASFHSQRPAVDQIAMTPLAKALAEDGRRRCMYGAMDLQGVLQHLLGVRM
ncbi:hypothetical protein PYCCODRAFT_605309 [Trametes coccinea BRFM310]|uniref:Uncharacterized protein n=1 Tax=Trametes coccinea (strain BRFM310) TaxID=1353009 RepID=A0A1Y2J1W1_TRAC3|nr:hypothetical protein PYCCODRAFT_605309 [Trametes coccinea BRFM310]